LCYLDSKSKLLGALDSSKVLTWNEKIVFLYTYILILNHVQKMEPLKVTIKFDYDASILRDVNNNIQNYSHILRYKIPPRGIK